MLAFADVMHFLADELTRLRAWCLAGALVCTGAFHGLLLGHTYPPAARSRNINATGMHGQRDRYSCMSWTKRARDSISVSFDAA